jgi:sugar lactone lactonase YvrE
MVVRGVAVVGAAMTLAAPLALGAGVAGAAAGEVQPGSIDTRAIGGTPVETTIVAPELGSPQGIAVDASGSIYVVGDRQVLVRSTAGKFRAIGYGYDTNPKGVAVDGAGNVYVVDSDRDRVLKRTPSGAVSTLGFTGLNDPRGLVVDSSGKVYVSDSINKRVVAITAGGALSTVAAGVGTPDDLALGPGGILYILDTAGRKVWKVPPGGSPTALAFPAFVKPVGIAVDGAGTVFVADDTDTFSQTIRSLTTGNVAATAVAPGLTGARGLSFDTAGNLLVVDDSGVVAKRTPAGAQTFVPFGSLSISNPRGVDVGPDGTVYFSGLNNVVSAYKPGQEQRTLPFSGLKTPRDVAVDGAGNVYVADVDLDQVLKLTPAGVQSTVSFGALVNPYGLAVDSANNLYVADRTGAGNSVYKRTPGGTVTNAGFTGLNGPFDIDVDSAGTLYVIDAAVGGGTRVLKRTTGGTQTTLPFTGTLLGQWVTVDSSGSVYVSKDGANRKVARLTTGGVETVVDLTGSVSPEGLAVGPDDALYVADPTLNPKIRRKLPNAFEVELGQDSVSDGPPSAVEVPAMAIGAGGKLLIADRNGDRILEYPGGGTAAPIGFSGLTVPTSIAADDSGHMYIAATVTQQAGGLRPGAQRHGRHARLLPLTSVSSSWTRLEPSTP